MKDTRELERAIDDMLVLLGGMVLRLSIPQVTRTTAERRALVRSVNQYSVCAAHSDDRRVREIRAEIEETIKPRLRLVVSR
jgi:ribosome recycling factor